MEQLGTKDSTPLPSGRDSAANFIEWKMFVDELREQWKDLWQTRVDDKLKAEGIANDEFPKLFVEKGTVILASRDFKPLDFHEIVRTHMSPIVADQVNPNPVNGGVGRFIKEYVRRDGSKRREPPQKLKKPQNQQQKHGGKGWLHCTIE